MQLPAELADIGDAQRPHLLSGNIDDANMAERKGRIGNIRIGDAGQHVARLRPHQRQRAVMLAHVGQNGVQTGPDMVPDPGTVMAAEACAGDDVEEVVTEARDCKIAFNTAARIEQLGIGQPPRRFDDVIGADMVQRRGGVLSGQFELGE